VSANNHLDLISITITLASAPLARAGFGTVLGMFEDITLDGDRYRTYTDLAAVAADNTAGYLSAEVLAAATAMFSQTTPPAKIAIGRVDVTASAETYAAALDAVEAAGFTDYWAVFMESRTAATQVAFATNVQTRRKMLFLQSSDAGWLTAGVPAAFSDLDGDERTVLIWHDDDTEWADAAWSANRLVFNPDTISAPFRAGVQAVGAYAAAMSSTQKDAARANNANIGLPMGTADFFVDPGTNMNGRPIYEILTADWFYTRLREDFAVFIVDKAASGQKIPVDVRGQAQALSLINSRLKLGVNAGHFIPDQVEATAEDITSADISAQELRFSGRAQLAVAARKFTFTFNFGRDPINE